MKKSGYPGQSLKSRALQGALIYQGNLVAQLGALL